MENTLLKLTALAGAMRENVSELLNFK